MRNLRFGSSQAPLKTRCKFNGCTAYIPNPRPQNKSGKPPFFRLRSYQQDNVLAMVNLDAISQVNTLKEIAWQLNKNLKFNFWPKDTNGKEFERQHNYCFNEMKLHAQWWWNREVGYKPKQGQIPMPFKRWENLVQSNGGAVR